MTFKVAGTKFTVIGIVSVAQGSTSADVYIPLARAQALASMKNKVNTVYVSAASAADIGAVSSEISTALPKATVTTSSDLASEVTGSLSSASSLANNLGKWLAVAVLAAAFGLASLLTVAAVSRRVREFGTLKALGWRNRRILSQIMGEALAIGLIGGAAGVALGFGGAALVQALAPPLTATTAASAPAGPGGGAGGPGAGGGFARAAQSTAHTVSVHLTAPVTLSAVLLAVVLALAGGLIAGCSAAGGPSASARPRPWPGSSDQPSAKSAEPLCEPRRETACISSPASPGTTRRARQTVHALAGVDLAIENGDWLAIQGPTGHGKSTLLQILGALDRPTSGTVRFDGQDLTRLRESQLTQVRATSIGFIFQSFNLIPTLSAQENVETALVPLRVASAERQERALRALTDVGLGDRARHLPSELSGGQQQRVAIARALVKQPTVLLADEPTGNLDEGTRDEIMTLLEQLWDQLRLTLVIVSHDSFVAARAQRTGRMENGRLHHRDPSCPPHLMMRNSAHVFA